MHLPFAKPLNKVSRGTFTAVFVVVLSLVMREYAIIDIPGEAQAALAVLIGYIVAYNTPLSEIEAKLIARKYYSDEATRHFANAQYDDELRRING